MSAHLSICQRVMPWRGGGGAQSVSSTGTRNVNVQLSSFFVNAYHLRNDQIIEYVEERILLIKETKTIQEDNSFLATLC